VGRRLEMRVAEAAVSAGRDAEPLALFGQVADQRLAVFLEDLRADRNLERHVAAIRAGPVAAHAVCPNLCLEMLLIAEVDERVEPVDGLRPDIATASAVAAIWSAEFNEFLAPERDAAAAAVSGLDIDLCFVEKFHFTSITGGY